MYRTSSRPLALLVLPCTDEGGLVPSDPEGKSLDYSMLLIDRIPA